MVKIRNAFELDEYLRDRYDTNFNDNITSGTNNYVGGTLKGEPFTITFYSGEALSLSMVKDHNDVLEELVSLLSPVMDDNKPICRYDNISLDTITTTIEWNVQNPLERIKKVIYEVFISNGQKDNLEVYINGEKKRIYGFDHGSIKTDKVDKYKTCNELELWLAIDALGEHLHHMLRLRTDEPVDITEEWYAFFFLVYQTAKFGVKLNNPSYDLTPSCTIDYYKWDHYWNNFVYKLLSPNDRKQLFLAYKSGEDTSVFMPIEKRPTNQKVYTSKDKK